MNDGAGLSAAEGADNVHSIHGVKGCHQVVPLLLVHKDSDVWSDLILLRDDPKPNARETTIQSRQCLLQRQAIDLHLALLGRVGSQGSGDMHCHGQLALFVTVRREIVESPSGTGARRPGWPKCT